MKVYANVLGENNSGNITIKRVKRNENEINEMIKKGIEERKREEEYKKIKENDDNFEETKKTINENRIDNNNSENKRNENEMKNKGIEERKREEENKKRKENNDNYKKKI